MVRIGSKVVAGAVLTGVALSGSMAYGAIPSGGGKVSGCYNNTNGNLRVIDAAKRLL